jgi:hypothetical protein
LSISIIPDKLESKSDDLRSLMSGDMNEDEVDEDEEDVE